MAVVLVVCAFYLGPSWLKSLTAVLVIFIPVVVVLGYGMRIRQSLSILKMLEDGKVEITVSEEGVETSSALGRSQL